MQDTVLAMTWRMGNDLDGLRQLYPLMMDLYKGVSIAMPPGDTDPVQDFAAQHDGIKLHIGTQPNESRRYQTVKQALEFDEVQFIHYCDGDHAISRMNRHLDDWKASLDAMPSVDCLIIGRSSEVFESYPPALKETERLINMTASHLLGMEVDLGSGARGFSRNAAEYLMKHASPETHAVATDSEWPVLLHKAGFTLGTYESSGAYYTIYNEEQRERLHSVEQWGKRVAIAQMIVQAALDATIS